MKKWGILVLILFLAAVLRFYRLASIPPSLDWDETSLGWNAYSILKTGTDEYGKAWPVSIRSFNDYKPPLYVYATVPSLALFGKNEFAVRFPSALAGILTVLVAFFLVKELTKSRLLGYLVTWLLAISPWSLQFSRAAFEANLALLFFVSAALFLVKFINSKSIFHLLSSTFAFVAAIYSYHSPRLVIPVFLLGVGVYYRKIFFEKWKISFLAGILFLVSLYPLARNTIHTQSATARFSDVSIFTLNKNPWETATLFAKNYLDNFSFDFLFLSGDKNDRHHAPDMGMMYLVESPFLLTGLYFLFSEKRTWRFIILWWLAVAPLAAAITTTSPHAIRSLVFLPIWQILTAYGLLKIVKTRLILSCFVCLLMSVNIYYFFHQYFIHFPVEFARNWQFGYKEVVAEVLSRESTYQNIFITTYYDQPYIYFLRDSGQF
jgi:4-amino-4-deoxy-L-arabinose transferase-like glycosyltransferase